MATHRLLPTTAAQKAAVLAALSLAGFVAYVLALAWAPLLAPASLLRLVGFHSYIGLLALAAALTVGLIFGSLYTIFFPANTLRWAAASSTAIAAAYLGLAYWSEPAGGEALWWIPVMEALLLVVLLPLMSYRRNAPKSAPAT
jgi:hypothetical protein